MSELKPPSSGALYQTASDGFDGTGDGVFDMHSGVIKSDGTWVACAAPSHSMYGQDWADYLAWVEAGNVPDPYLAPADGGYAITLREGEVAYGSMLNSMPVGWVAPTGATPAAEPAQIYGAPSAPEGPEASG
jgi:hypothetical protein